jgi:alkaline phosphatase D
MKKVTSLLLLVCFLFVNSFAQRSIHKSGQAPFFHGVASGDPLTDKVMIWTKLTPPTGSSTDIDVFWQISTDVNFNNIVNFGRTKATEMTDFTVKVDVCGLQPGTYYYYAFRALDVNSITGRTKTAPSGSNARARFGVVSCSSYEHGYFNAYESLSQVNDLDAVLHLGDYIYEYATGGYSSSTVTGAGRIYEPANEIITLEDYRVRHSHYKLDNQLQLIHQLHPFITTWDDHESANDAWVDGAQNHTPASEGPWNIRKANSAQAYMEYLPVREPDPTNNLKLWRDFRYGNLLDLIVLDTRLWGRDEQSLTNAGSTNRTILGQDQFTWFENKLADNTTQWKIIPQQVMMAPLEAFGVPVNSDQWDGYLADRNRFINYLENNNLRNTVVLTGDIHTAWASNVPGNNTNRAATEFVTTSVTSPGAGFITSAFGGLLGFLGGTIEAVIRSLNSHIKYNNLTEHGYYVLTVDANKTQADFYNVPITPGSFTTTRDASWFTNAGNPNVQSTNTPIAAQTGPAVPSTFPNQNIDFVMLQDTFLVNATENTVLNTCLLNVLNLCPTKISTIIDNPLYGSATSNIFCINYTPINNFYGTDFMTIIFCETSAPTQCDTSVVQINIIGVNDIETIVYQIDSDSTLTDCPAYNDLVFTAQSFDFTFNSFGTFDYVNGCFTYTPSEDFNGVELATLFACDSIGICDTINLQFIVSGSSTTQIIQINANAGQLVSNCLGFDDLDGNLVNSNITYSGVNGNTILFGDTCISYSSNPTFNGTDTIIVYGCDDFIPQVCDTIIYYINVTGPIIDTTISIKEIKNNDFAIMGIYPNPFDREIIVQFYQFTNEPLEMNLYDAIGKKVFSSKMGDNSVGLKYFRLEASNLANGQYFFDINNGKHSYTKQVLKYGN